MFSQDLRNNFPFGSLPGVFESRAWYGHNGTSQLEVARCYSFGLCHDDCSFYSVLQFSDVAGPSMARKHLQGVGIESEAVLVKLGAKPSKEILRQQLHITVALPQRGHAKDNDSQPIIEVFAEAALLHSFL